jgi:hypothetical protein
MAHSSAAASTAASTATGQTETAAAPSTAWVRPLVKLVGAGGTFLSFPLPLEEELKNPRDYSLFVSAYAKAYSLDVNSVIFYQLKFPEDEMQAKRYQREAARRTAGEIEQAADREEYDKLDGGSVIQPGSYLLAVVTPKSAAPSSTTGKCPHNVVVPSVARSSLTWSCALCVRCCGCWCRGRIEQ